MPIPSPNQDEKTKDFVNRCMSNPTMNKEYPDNRQRMALCMQQTKKRSKGILANVVDYLDSWLNCDICDDAGNVEELTLQSFIMPKDEDYVDFKDSPEDILVENMFANKYEYIDPMSGQVYVFDRMGIYKKNNKVLTFKGKSHASEYQGRKVTLNKPFRTPKGPKKFSVYVKNEKGNVVKVNFGDPNMKIKKNIPERRKSFRARHNCDNPGPKYKARYWSCKAW
jgi:hypothetical protein